LLQFFCGLLMHSLLGVCNQSQC